MFDGFLIKYRVELRLANSLTKWLNLMKAMVERKKGAIGPQTIVNTKNPCALKLINFIWVSSRVRIIIFRT